MLSLTYLLPRSSTLQVSAIGSLLLGLAACAHAEVLPDPLVMNDGTPVTTAEQWTSTRRGEVLELFKQHVYGTQPPAQEIADVVRHTEPVSVLGGKARMLQETLYFNADHSGPKVDLLIYLPAEGKTSGPYPTFLTPNFFGNHTIDDDPHIRDSKPFQRVRTQRGGRASHWALEDIASRGYALVTFCYGDVDPDNANLRDGVHALFDIDTYQNREDNWAAIGAWAWGSSRVLDYLERLAEIDSNRVIIMGHSRLGKAALWTGATDERFAAVISNESGGGGAALCRGKDPGEETVAQLNDIYGGAWFAKKFQDYSHNEDALPIDQHMLVALIAPRPVYVGTAREDIWSDADGMFRAITEADPVYKLLGTAGLPHANYPIDDSPILGGQIGFHIREGGHSVTEYDWEQYLNFADSHFAHRDADGPSSR